MITNDDHESGNNLLASVLIAELADAILALRQLVEIHCELGHSLEELAYINLKAAFDSVEGAALWKVLKRIGTSTFIPDLVREQYTNKTSRVRVEDEFSPTIFAMSDVLQG